jgi:hypothetical protein
MEQAVTADRTAYADGAAYIDGRFVAVAPIRYE